MLEMRLYVWTSDQAVNHICVYEVETSKMVIRESVECAKVCDESVFRNVVNICGDLVICLNQIDF